MSNPVVTIQTNQGAIEVELFADKAPKSVENFLAYVDAKHYSETIFHRVIKGFMIQGGGFDQQLEKKKVRAAVENEGSSSVLSATSPLLPTRIVDSTRTGRCTHVDTVRA